MTGRTPGELQLAAYTDASTFGGAEQVLATIVGGLGPDVHITLVGTSARVLDTIGERRPSAERVIVPPVRTKWDVVPIVAHLRAFRRIRPDVCHVNLRTPYASQYGLLAALLVPDLPVLAVEHLPLHSESAVSRWLKRQTSRRLAAHVAVGHRAAREVEGDAGLPAGSIDVIHNGVPPPAPAEPQRLAPSPVIGAIGRLDPQKGFDVLIDALPALPEATAVLVGDGPERASLEARAAARGVDDRVVFTGWRTDAAALLSGFDVLAVPSRSEGLPLVILEAFSARVPVVAADVGSVCEAVTSGTGVLVASGDATALAAAIGDVLGDEGLRRTVVDGAHAAWREQFDAKRMSDAYDRLYRTLAR